MKRVLVLIIIGISIALVMSSLVQYDPGYVRISIGNLLLESNLWVMLTLNLLFIAAIIALLSLTRRAFLSSKAVTSWFGKSGQQKAKQNTEKGLIALLEGNWGNANKLLSRSANKSNSPIINYLAAAHAANELGQTKDAEQLLKKAYDSTPDSEFAVGIAQAQIQLQQEQYEPCLATLLRLKKQQENHPFILKLLKSVYLKLEDWQQLLALIPALRKNTIVSDKKLKELEAMAWNRLFIQKGDELEHRSQQAAATEILASLWKQIPDQLRFESHLVETYAHQLIRLDQSYECETLLRKILNKRWNDQLVAIYGIVEGANLSEQLIHAENWLKERPNNAALLLALGRLSLRNALWGKALEYLEASKRLHANKENLAELCRLSISLKQNSGDYAADFGFLIESLNLPDMPLPKR